jgi:hypothetical protein
MKRREISFLVFSIIVATVFGGLIGDIVSGFLPDGTAKLLLGKQVEIGI